jgi:hypothetical protein
MSLGASLTQSHHAEDVGKILMAVQADLKALRTDLAHTVGVDIGMFFVFGVFLRWCVFWDKEGRKYSQTTSNQFALLYSGSWDATCLESFSSA